MKKWLRSISLLLAMVLVLSACGSKPAEEEKAPVTSEKTETSTKTEEKKEETPAAPEKIEKFDPAITITTVRQDTSASTQDYKDGESVANNAWTQLFAEKYGVNVEYLWLAANGEDYATKFNMLLNSGELPDYLEVEDLGQFQQLAEAGLIQPMGEIYDMYASDLTKQVIGESGDVVWEAATFGGEIMGVPWTGAPKEGAPLLYIRQDWLDNLGMEAPKTMADLIALAEAFATQDPDKDGKQDTYAIAMDKDAWNIVCGFFQVNGFHNGNWYMKDGELTNGYVDDGYKQTLQLLADWYAKGYIHKEWYTFDSAKTKEQFANGEVGICFGSYSAPISYMSAQHANEPDTDWLVMVAPDWDGNPVKSFAGLGVYSYFVASKDCEHPEAIIMMLNEFVEKFYFGTDQDEYYKYINSENGAHIWQNAHVRAYRGEKNVAVGESMEAYYAGTKTADQLTAEERATVAQIDAYNAGDETMWQWNKVFGVGQAASLVREYMDADAYEYVVHYGLPTETEAVVSSILLDYAKESRLEFIKGEKSFDQWDAYVEEYKSLGYDTVKEEILAKYGLK